MVPELLKDANPFKISASVSFFFQLVVLFTLVSLFLTLQLSQMSFFGASDIWQHQLSHLSHMRVGAQEMYDKVQVDSKVP